MTGKREARALRVLGVMGIVTILAVFGMQIVNLEERVANGPQRICQNETETGKITFFKVGQIKYPERGWISMNILCTELTLKTKTATGILLETETEDTEDTVIKSIRINSTSKGTSCFFEITKEICEIV